MKTRFFFLSLALASVMVSCTDGLSDQLQWDEGVMVTLSDYQDVTGTRVAFNNSLTSFTWSNGDCIGVCRSSAASNGTAAFTLLKGGATVGNFINDSFSLNPKADYYAFYPFAVGTTASAFPIDITGQVQTANNSTAHIGKVNYMSAAFTTDDNGKASFTFSNIGTVIQLHFTAENEDTYSGLSVSSSGNGFTTQASYNLKDNTITPSKTSSVFQVSFGEEGMHVYNGESVVITAIVLPDDLSQSTLTFSIKNRAGAVVKKMDLAGFAFSSGKLYHFYEDDSKGNPPYGSCPDGNHPHAIDLGLPSGTLWSCLDMGAEKPIEGGIGFVWGQTDYVEKNSSTWENYEYMNESYLNEWGINKYQIADEQTDGVWYNGDGSFVGDKKTTLESGNDAARVNWGGKWRMPQKKDCVELVNYTYHVYVSDYNETGVDGIILYKKKASNKYTLWDPHLFIPASSHYYDRYTGNHSANSYWTSSLGTETRNAYSQVFDFYYYYVNHDPVYTLSTNTKSRIEKHHIRPVQSPFTGDSGSQSGGRP